MTENALFSPCRLLTKKKVAHWLQNAAPTQVDRPTKQKCSLFKADLPNKLAKKSQTEAYIFMNNQEDSPEHYYQISPLIKGERDAFKFSKPRIHCELPHLSRMAY
jgi:hypothetical protein